jgi:hypothetical protein
VGEDAVQKIPPELALHEIGDARALVTGARLGHEAILRILCAYVPLRGAPVASWKAQIFNHAEISSTQRSCTRMR